MTDKQIIDCEYLKIDEMRTCKALDVSFYGDIICNDEDCIILKLKQQLKAKEQECEELKKSVRSNKDKRKSAIERYLKLKEFTNKEFNKLKAENEKMLKGYEELTEIVSSYIDDFTGYNEELKGFDIVLCVKELMKQLDQLKGKITAQEIDQSTYIKQLEKTINRIRTERDNYKQTLAEIRKIAKKGCIGDYGCSELDQILQKCKEIEEWNKH